MPRTRAHRQPTVGATQATPSQYPASTTLAYNAAPADAIPAYLTPATTESQWSNKVRRISDIAGQRQRYSSKAAWNCDMSLLLLDYPPGGSGTSRALLHGTTYAVLQASNDTKGYFTWSTVNPDVAWAYSGTSILKLSVTSGAGVTVSATYPLSALGGTAYGSISLGGGQGSEPDNTDRYLAFQFKKTNNDHGVGVFDTTTQTVLYERVVANSTATVEAVVNNCGMSHSGDYVVAGMASSGTGASLGTHIYPRDLSTDLQITTTVTHWDWGRLAAGTDVLVICSQSATGGGTGSRLGMYQASNGAFTALITNWPNGHVSGRNTQRPGWIYPSTFDSGGTNFVGYQTVFALNLDNPSEVQMFSHVHGPSAADTAYNAYITQPHAVPSPDGKRVLFASRWGGADVYPFVASLT